MIQNLNRLSFGDFGTVLPQSPEQTDWQLPWTRLSLSCDTQQTFRAAEDTYISSDPGMTVLSVQSAPEVWRDFYLDKAVMVRKGVCFRLCAFQDTSAVHMASPVKPVDLGAQIRKTNFSITAGMSLDKILTFFYQEKESGFLFSGESHPVYELTYVDQGSLHSVVDGQDLLLEQGDLMFYGPGQWHMQYSDIHVAPRFLTISFQYAGHDLSSLLNRKFRCSHNILYLLQIMIREQENMDDYSNDVILSCIGMLLLQLLRSQGSPAAELKSAHSLSNENEIIRKAQQYISSHVRSKLSVPLVASSADVSPSYLTALFHKHLQISPGEYIRRIKLQESKLMIREGTMNFTQIAQTLEYSTIHHFSRQFKEKFGITPTQYAKSIR